MLRPLYRSPITTLFSNNDPYRSDAQDFRTCQALIQEISATPTHAFPPKTRPTRHEALAAQNVQRGLAATVQEVSAAFRKKQRVYMES
jgi:syntaxin 16